jgi:dTDP-4-amino-4,6-dideoxygalactose transaminase
MIRLAAPEFGDEEIRAVEAVLRSGFLVQGERVREFERRVAATLGVRHAVAVSSGTAALHVALLATGIGPGDVVIVPDFTVPAPAHAVRRSGAQPVLVDIDAATYNIDPAAARAAVGPRTKALLPVHLFGQPADMDPLLALARERGLLVIEDAACALGAEYRGRRCGTMGLAGCFSFHPRKVITTGEGGMIVTDDDGVAAEARRLRNHGMTGDPARPFDRAGFNCRMTEMQGALGVVQMGRLETLIARRTALARRYHERLAGVPAVTPPAEASGVRHVWQAYVAMLRDGVPRDRVVEGLRSRDIEAAIGTYSVGALPHFADAAGDCPRSRRAGAQSLCLPLHPGMTEGDVDAVCAVLQGAVA